MKKIKTLQAVLIVLIMLVTTSVAYAAPPDQRNFIAHLSGDSERPVPVDTDAGGLAVLHVNKDETEIRYKLIVTNLENATMAHIHCGSADVAGPVVAFLFGPVAGVSDNGVLAEGTVTATDVISRPDSAACPGGVADFDDLLAKIRSGDAYVNVHTMAFPGGEIRGQIE